MVSWVHICHPKFCKLAQVTIVTGHRVCGMGQHYEMSWVCRCMPCQLHLWDRLHQYGAHTAHKPTSAFAEQAGLQRVWL